VAYLSTTDAVCYHDGHRSLDGRKDPVFEVPIFGDDGALRDDKTIRVTDMAFDEDVLLDQDRFLTALLNHPDFQNKMTGTEMRNKLGRWYHAIEERNGVEPGLLAKCHEMAIPVFVGAPGDGSVFLNSMKLWAMREAGLIPSYKSLATFMLGGGVPKNYNLQPEPALGQILGLPDVRGYEFDVQITSAPVTDGSLSSCPPAEAVTWGKVDRDTYQQSTESMQGDYSMVVPFLIKALLDRRAKFERLREELGEATLFERHPEARGYLRPRAGYRLFEQREALVGKLREAVRENADWLKETLTYPLATPTK